MHHELQLVGTGTAGLDHIGLEVEHRRELDEVRDRVIAAWRPDPERAPRGARTGRGPALRRSGGRGVRDLHRHGPPSRSASTTVLRSFARKLGHVNLLSDEKPELERFILDVLGLPGLGPAGGRGDVDAMRPLITTGSPSPRPSGGTRLHHYAWELEGWSAMGRYADHVACSGPDVHLGPRPARAGVQSLHLSPRPGRGRRRGLQRPAAHLRRGRLRADRLVDRTPGAEPVGAAVAPRLGRARRAGPEAELTSCALPAALLEVAASRGWSRMTWCIRCAASRSSAPRLRWMS